MLVRCTLFCTGAISDDEMFDIITCYYSQALYVRTAEVRILCKKRKDHFNRQEMVARLLELC